MKKLFKTITALVLSAAILSPLGDMPLTVGAAAEMEQYCGEYSSEESKYLELEEYGASTLAAPTASRKSGTITVTKDHPTVKLSAEKGSVYYSLNDGKYQKYTSAIKLTENSTIKAYAQSGSTKSKTVKFTYKLKPKVTFSVQKISSKHYLVDLVTNVDRVNIYYTTDGSKPTTSSTRYNFSPIQIVRTTKIRAIAVKNNWATASLAKNITIAGTSSVVPTRSTADVSTEISTETLSDGTPVWTNITMADGSGPLFAYGEKEKVLYYKGVMFDEVVFPSKVTGRTVRSVAVASDEARIKSITIPDTVTRVPDEAFRYCSSLTSLVLPDGITSIGQDAFRHCNSLKSINIPDGVTEIGEKAFLGCESLKSINIPNGVTKIGKDTFNGCKSLKSVTIPSSVTKLDLYAFANCTSLTSITIPDSVKYLDWHVFNGCTSLKSVTIPDSITETGPYVFANCTSLESVTLSDNLRYIADGLFDGCTSLKSITIPGSVKEIGSGAFKNCTSLLTITIPDGVTKIYPNAFEGCSGLVQVNLPDSLTEIGAGMRYDIFEYTYVDDSAFIGCNCFVTYKGRTYYPNEYEALYRAVNGH